MYHLLPLQDLYKLRLLWERASEYPAFYEARSIKYQDLGWDVMQTLFQPNLADLAQLFHDASEEWSGFDPQPPPMPLDTPPLAHSFLMWIQTLRHYYVETHSGEGDDFLHLARKFQPLEDFDWAIGPWELQFRWFPEGVHGAEIPWEGLEGLQGVVWGAVALVLRAMTAIALIDQIERLARLGSHGGRKRPLPPLEG